MDACELCVEFSGGPVPVSGFEQDSRVIWQDDRSIVIPPLGCFVPGYVMYCPVQHVTSIANVGDPLRGVLLERLAAIRREMEPAYGTTVVFEHGMTSTGASSGGCVEHAHLHVVPYQGDVRDLVGLQMDQGSPAGLGAWRERSYLLVIPPDEQDMLISHAPGLPSQYMRRRIAERLGMGEQFDWALFPFVDEMIATRDTMRNVLQRLD